MDRVNQYAFYEFGEALGQLRKLKEGMDIGDFILSCWQGDQGIDKFLADASKVPLKLSNITARKLKTQLTESSDITNKKIDWEVPVKAHQITPIRKALDEFEAVFSNEAQSLEVFSIPQKGAYSISTLMEQGDRVLPEAVNKAVSDFTRNELREAGKCIAFDLPTASGFHLVRALESAIRDYYDKLSNGAPRPKYKNGNDAPMGDYIAALEKLKADKDVIETLRQIKKLHRDTHMHPESVFEPGEDTMLLGVVTSAIWSMFK